MKLLLVGNHTCGNRGDCAILRGLLTEIHKLRPDARIEITSRFPVSSSFLLGRAVAPDAFDRWRRLSESTPLGRARHLTLRKLTSFLMFIAVRFGLRLAMPMLPSAVLDEIYRIKDFDAVVHVGGSFFVDAYGIAQYDYALATILAGRPLILAGHSMGPFKGRIQRQFARLLLDRAKVIALREAESLDLMEGHRLTNAVTSGADTAWLTNQDNSNTALAQSTIDRCISVDKPTIAVSIRDLAPFDRSLAVRQEDYENAFVRLINALIGAGYHVIALSTCTGIEGYRRDDRVSALRVAAQVGDCENFVVVMDELNDLELGSVFKQCHFVISTRLHAAIIAMNAGTPAYAIRYEHKSEGIMRQLGLPELSVTVESFMSPEFFERVIRDAERRDTLARHMNARIALERRRAADMVAKCMAQVPGHLARGSA